MAKFKPAQNYSVSGNHFVQDVGDLKLWEKRNFPTVNGEKGEQFNTYLLTKEVKVPSKAYNGTRLENVNVTEEFNTPEEAIAQADSVK